MDPAKWEGIVEKAAAHFARFGFKKTSIDDVARAAGVAKGTVYLGCASKQDLLFQAILRDLRLWNAELSRALDPRVPADELLARVARAALATLDRFPLARELLLDTYAAVLPDWRDRLDDLRSHGLSTVTEILRVGVRQRRIRADLDVDLVSRLFVDFLTATIMFHARGGPAELERRAAAAVQVVLEGLRPRPRAARADLKTEPVTSSSRRSKP
jgi:AcrR family transcriptional regulator